MKLALFLAAFASAGLVPIPDSARSPCCAIVSTDDKPADLLAASPPNGPARSLSSGSIPLTAHSLYQLDATWTNDADQPVRLASLRGQPVVLVMFFASCEYACPILVSEMQRLRETLPAAVRASTHFVLVSFDTARDTPAVLKAYRERMSLDDGWALLRGEAGPVQELAMLLGVKFKQDARGNFAHSNLITILNPEGEIAHQRPGLQGDVSEAAKAVVLAAK